ncbi:uncharacterized protein LOC125420917 [Ziziphus jujuba]|uniref:Uncharacterized protein LOC125420917 n=1 Tax=Ziziphus jujuba TaxID=326968 RepID=A0ABM3IAE4_ZIZJJ|nr:uncharacterized protein LOC125420917 [Ziziphus jujuba]
MLFDYVSQELPIQCPHEVSNWLLGMDDAMEVDDGHDLALVPYGVSSSNAYSGGSNGSHIPMQFGSLCLGHLGPSLSMLRVGLGEKSKSNVQLSKSFYGRNIIHLIMHLSRYLCYRVPCQMHLQYTNLLYRWRIIFIVYYGRISLMLKIQDKLKQSLNFYSDLK